MMKVGDKFKQDGHEYVAANETDICDPCNGCAFEKDRYACSKAPMCSEYAPIIDTGFIFVEVKK